MKKRSHVTEKGRRVTEDDLRVTEALIGVSFGRLKKAAISAANRAPAELLKPASDAIREHPVATTAAAASAGVIAYELIKLFTPKVVVKEVVQPQVSQEASGRMDVFSRLIAAALPFVANYVQQELGKKRPERQY